MSELEEKLSIALKSKHYFITISYCEENTLQHYWNQQGYKKDDFIPTLDHLKHEVYRKEIQKRKEGWK